MRITESLDVYYVYVSWFRHETKKVREIAPGEWQFYEEGNEDNFCMFRY